MSGFSDKIIDNWGLFWNRKALAIEAINQNAETFYPQKKKPGVAC
jgi:hypothetical protein